MRRLVECFAAVSILVGCSSASTGPPAERACDPLATHPTTLGVILGVGKDPAGTLYVVDQGGVPTQPSIVRVFVVSRGSLVRQDVIGSGEIGTGEDIETFQSADGSTAPRDLDVQLEGRKATSMTLGAEGSAKAKIDGLDAGAPTPLVLVDPSVVQGLRAIDLPGVVSYVADAADGHAIVITAPLESDLGTAAFRLFYGTPADMVERPIVSFNQALSGYPTIAFTVGSQSFVMDISSVPSPDGGPFEAPGPVTLTGGGQAVPFTLRLPAPTTLVGFTFSCVGS